MKKIFAIFALICAASICAHAQANKYACHDAELILDLKGPVKHFKSIYTYDFDETGKYQTNDKIERDNKGYITKRKTENGEYVYEYDRNHRLINLKHYAYKKNFIGEMYVEIDKAYSYTYDSNGRLSSEKTVSYYGGVPAQTSPEVEKYYYDTNGNLIKLVESGGFVNRTKEYNYSDIKNDAYGNWIERTVKNPKGKVSRSTREITYWGAQQGSNQNASRWNQFNGEALHLLSYEFPDGRTGTSDNEVFRFNLSNNTYTWTGQQYNRNTAGRISISGDKLTIYEGDKVFDTWTIVSYNNRSHILKVKCTYLGLTRRLHLRR